MANTPRNPQTLRNPHSEVDGRPCIHFGDKHGNVFQVHHDEAVTGFYVTCAMVHPIFGVLDVHVELTPGQTGELMDFLRAEA